MFTMSLGVKETSAVGAELQKRLAFEIQELWEIASLLLLGVV